jgi:hypothetical protein
MKLSKTISLIAIGAVLCALPLAAQKDEDKVVESVWTSAPIQVDGSNLDWPPESLALQRDFNVSYGFRNDTSFLYLIAVFNDPKFLSSLGQTGMFFWINAEGKDKKTYGLHLYQKSIPADQLIAEMEKNGQTLTEEKKAELKAHPQYLKLACDEVNKKGQPVPNPGQRTGTFRYVKGKTNAVFEAAIPLALLNDPAGAAALDPSKPFKFGIEWGSLTEEMKKARAAQVGDQAVRARGDESSLDTQVSGGDEEGRIYSPDASLASMRRGPRQHSFWINLKISEPK